MFPSQCRVYLLVAVLVALGVSGTATIHAVFSVPLLPGEDSSPQEGDEDIQNTSQEEPVFRPHLRKEDRDAMREEHRQQELIGEQVSRTREGMQEAGQEVDIEKLREEAIERLEQTAGVHMAPPELPGQPHDFEQIPQAAGACFRSDGSTTNNRDECDSDQGQHLGFREEFMHQDAASPAFMEKKMQERFGGFSPSTKTSPNIAKGILMMMDGMMNKLPMVITLFEQNGIPVSQDARSAAQQAKALFEEIRPACESNPMNCMRLREVAVILESRMRPSMEQAVMTSGNMQLGMQIQQMMAEDGMMGPPPMMDQMGPPPGFDSMHMGAPEGFGPPSDFGPPGMMGDIESRMMQCMMSGGTKSDCMDQVMGSGFPR